MEQIIVPDVLEDIAKDEVDFALGFLHASKATGEEEDDNGLDERAENIREKRRKRKAGKRQRQR